MAIYYWYNQGRLGNLLFQYAAIVEATTKEDLIICFDNELFKFIEPSRKLLIIKSPKFLRFFPNRKINDLFGFFSKKKVICSLTPRCRYEKNEYLVETSEISLNKGFFRNIVLVKGFFQYDKWVLKNIQLKQNVLEKIKIKLSKLSVSECKVAVHIRSTDYKDWIVYGKKDATLNNEWYRLAIDHAIRKLRNPQFIFFTDDENYVDSLDLTIPVVIFKGNSPMEDLLAMTLCDHAIISPSTFSYFGSILSYTKGKLIIAPKFWAGFKSNTWYPPTIETSMMYYLKVSN